MFTYFSYTSQLTEAAEHIVNFLDAKDKEVAGTTYKNLKDLIRQINECGYFEKTVAEEEQVTTEQSKKNDFQPGSINLIWNKVCKISYE